MTSFIKGMIVALITMAADQASKWCIFNLLQNLEPPVISLTSFFDLVIVHNYGISFGMLSDLPYGQSILTVVAVVIILILCLWLPKVTKAYVIVAIGLIIGGALGNVIDRVRFGSVFDFLDFYIGSYHWPAFNLADSAVFVGVVLLCIDSYQEYKREHENHNT